MTDTASWVITGLAVVVMAVAFFSTPRYKRGQNTLPTILTTLGILGTFCGIAWGLMSFNLSDPQASIAQLLSGLKIAFLTSIAGMLGAIAVKWGYNLRPSEEDGVEGATVDTLAEQLNKLIDVTEKQHNDLTGHLSKVEQSLVGEGETTIITQLQKLRTGLVDSVDDSRDKVLASLLDRRQSADQHHEELKGEFTKFAEKVADNNSKALIEALQEVIRDFNAKINEQFGDNFKQLNEAVGKLLEWQEQYRQQMIELTDKFTESGKTLDQIGSNLSDISSQVSTVMELVDELDGIMQTAKVHLDALKQSVEAHAQLADKAENAFPVIEQNMTALTEGFAKNVDSTIESSRKSVEKLQLSLEEQSTFLDEHTKQVARSSNKVFEELGSSVESLVRENNKKLSTQFATFHDNMETELRKAISGMGSHLASLSEKMVSDYSPLTDRLRKVIELASDGDRDR